MDWRSIIEQRIQTLVNQNCYILEANSFVYHGNTYANRLVRNWTQFFAPLESAKIYVMNNNSDQRKEEYFLHKYKVTNSCCLLNLTPNPERSDQINELIQYIAFQLYRYQLFPYLREIDPNKINEYMQIVEVIKLFTRILFGLDIHYDRAKINELVVGVASKLTFPHSEIDPLFVHQLLNIIDSHECTPGRVSFSTLDKMYCAAFAKIIKICQIPINGLYFEENDSPDQCCHQINKLDENLTWNTCVPTEYIIFEPIKFIRLVQSLRIRKKKDK